MTIKLICCKCKSVVSECRVIKGKGGVEKTHKPCEKCTPVRKLINHAPTSAYQILEAR
jgi:hypothetical protein